MKYQSSNVCKRILTGLLILISILAFSSCAVKKTPDAAKQDPAVQEKPVAEEEHAADSAEDLDESDEISQVKWEGIRVSGYGMRKSSGRTISRLCPT